MGFVRNLKNELIYDLLGIWIHNIVFIKWSGTCSFDLEVAGSSAQTCE